MCGTAGVCVPRCPLARTAQTLRSFQGRVLPLRRGAFPSRWTEGSGSSDIFSDDFSPDTLDATDLAENLALEDGTSLEPPTELIFSLQRRGEGWGEQIMPQVTIEWRPIVPNKRIRHRSQGPSPWEEGSLESELLRAGVPCDVVENVAAAAAAWRVTPLGRPLIDRRRRARVQRNAKAVIDYLEQTCGVPLGFDGVAQILMHAPQILLSKVQAVDRWNVRVIELAAFMHLHGHCNVPHSWSVSPTLGRWVQRQRVLYKRKELSEERVQILHALGFQFSKEIIVFGVEWTKELDAYVEWVAKRRDQRQYLDDCGINWFQVGGWRAACLAVWAIHQRELRRRGCLPKEVIRRLNYSEFKWTVEISPPELKEWMAMFGELTVVVNSHKSHHRQSATSSELADFRTRVSRNRAYSMEDISFRGDAPARAAELESLWDAATLQECPCERAISAMHGLLKLDRLDGLDLSPELELWLRRQQLLWRRCRLSTDKVALLYALGVDLDPYTREAWIRQAHQAAKLLNNFEIEMPLDGQDSEEEAPLDTGPSLLVMPKDIVSVSKAGDIVERVDLRTFQAVRNEVNVLAMEPDVHTAQAVMEKESVLPQKGKDRTRGDVERRLSVQEWVLTQRALSKEQRLSRTQMHYLAILGLTWLLCKDIVEMEDSTWWQDFEATKAAKQGAKMPKRLQSFLRYQMGLYHLGWLPTQRTEALKTIGFNFDLPERSLEDQNWDRHLAEFLQCPTKQKDGLSSAFLEWLEVQEHSLASLPTTRALQLRVIKEQLRANTSYRAVTSP